MDKIDCIKLFVHTARLGSFTASANELGLSQGAVSKKIAWLEHQLDLTLFQRNSRKISLTHAGHHYLEYSQRLLEEMETVESRLKREERSVEGTLTLSAPSAFSSQQLAPVLAKFMARHPKIRFNMNVDDKFVNLNDHQVDIAIRASNLTDSGLKARFLFRHQLHYFVSPHYIDNCGEPKEPQDLHHHACLSYSLMQPSDKWLFVNNEQERLSLKINQVFMSDSPDVLLSMAKQGVGIAALPSWMGEDLVAKGELVTILKPWSYSTLPMYAVYHSSDYIPQRIRVFIDFLADYFYPK